MTLNKTWEECLRMWKWIDSQVAESYGDDDDSPVESLKEEWLEDYGYDPSEINFMCFFCNMAGNSHSGASECEDKCPAVAIDPDFDCCMEDDDGYNFEMYPKAFYRS